MQRCVTSIGCHHNALNSTARSHRALQHICRRHASTYQRHVAVLGGGITGLATAYYIRQHSPHVRVSLFEAKDTLGGWLQSTRIPVDNGSVLFEAGPRSLRPAHNGVLAGRLINELGLKDETIFTPKTSAAASHRYLFYPDHLVRMPHPSFGILANLRSLWTEPIFRGAFQALLNDYRTPARDQSIKDESISAMFTRRLNANLVDNILSGVIHGIYAGDVDKLSAKSIFPRLWVDDGTAGSFIVGGLQNNTAGALMKASDVAFIREMQSYSSQWDEELFASLSNCSVFTFKDGIAALSDALARRLWDDDGVEIRTSASVRGLEALQDKQRIKLQLKEEAAEVFDRVVSTLSASHLGGILGSDISLPQIPSVNVMTVNLFYDTQEPLPPGPGPDQLGFGYLIPRGVPFEQNPERALGVVFDHAYAPLKAEHGGALMTQDELPSGGTKLTVMLGGHWWNDWPAFPDESEGKELAQSIVSRHLGINREPTLCRVNMQRDCIPQYNVGHEDRLKEIHQTLQKHYGGKLRVAGSWISGVGVNDCLRSAWDVSRSLLDNKDNTGLELVGVDDWVRARIAPGQSSAKA